jgi:hypothetical protein
VRVCCCARRAVCLVEETVQICISLSRLAHARPVLCLQAELKVALDQVRHCTRVGQAPAVESAPFYTECPVLCLPTTCRRSLVTRLTSGAV